MILSYFPAWELSISSSHNGLCTLTAHLGKGGLVLSGHILSWLITQTAPVSGGTETTHPALSWKESDRCKRQSNSYNLLQIKDGCKRVHGRPCGRASGRLQFSQSCFSLNGCSSIISLALNRKGIETSPCCEGQPLINRDKKWSWALKLMFLLSAFISALDFCSELNNGDVHIPEDPYLNCIQEVGRVEKGLFGISFVGRSATCWSAENVI